MSLAPLRLKLLLKSWKGVNHQVLIKFWQKWLKQEVKHYIQRITNLLILFWKKEQLLQHRNKSIIVQIYKKGS
jgi:hypothetical protein